MSVYYFIIYLFSREQLLIVYFLQCLSKRRVLHNSIINPLQKFSMMLTNVSSKQTMEASMIPFSFGGVLYSHLE